MRAQSLSGGVSELAQPREQQGREGGVEVRQEAGDVEEEVQARGGLHVEDGDLERVRVRVVDLVEEQERRRQRWQRFLHRPPQPPASQRASSLVR